MSRAEPTAGPDRSSKTCEAPEPPIHVFTPELIEKLRERSDPPTALEAELGGPWEVREIDGGFGLFRSGDQECGEGPVVQMASRPSALMAAAALGGLARSPYRVHPEGGGSGYPIVRDGIEVGSTQYFLADLGPALDVVEAILRTPSALACLLEAAGATALARAGRELGARLAQVER